MSDTPRTDAWEIHAGAMDANTMVVRSVSVRELERELATGWIPVSERMPENEQTVLACWVGPSICNPGMETLIYHAADAPDGAECWRDVFGEERDPPTHWTLKDLPK